MGVFGEQPISSTRRFKVWLVLLTCLLWHVCNTRWRHQMETFSTLLALCAGNSPVSSEFPAQRPVTRSFDVFFDLRLNKRLSKQPWGWWFETLSWSLWRHRNDKSEVFNTTHLLHSLAWTRHIYGIIELDHVVWSYPCASTLHHEIKSIKLSTSTWKSDMYIFPRKKHLLERLTIDACIKYWICWPESLVNLFVF